MVDNNAKQVELIGKVIEEPELVDGSDWLVRVESQGKGYDVILKRCKRWVKPGILMRFTGILRDDTLLAFSYEEYRG